jgi:hypothetical protein
MEAWSSGSGNRGEIGSRDTAAARIGSSITYLPRAFNADVLCILLPHAQWFVVPPSMHVAAMDRASAPPHLYTPSVHKYKTSGSSSDQVKKLRKDIDTLVIFLILISISPLSPTRIDPPRQLLPTGIDPPRPSSPPRQLLPNRNRSTPAIFFPRQLHPQEESI